MNVQKSVQMIKVQHRACWQEDEVFCAVMAIYVRT